MATVRSSHTAAPIDPEWLVNQIAHALRNPIFAATVQAEALALKAAGQEQLTKSATMIQGQLARLEADLEEMLLLGRPARVAIQPADLVAVARSAIDAVRAAAREETADVRLTRAETPVTHLTDPSAVRIVLERLITNAVQHTPPPHSVEVELSAEPDGAASLTVRDAGGGISRELIDKIFLPFYPQHRGRPGLGLAVAAKFAHAVGGHIEITSEPGSGTTARLVLPAGPPAAEG